MDSLSWNKTFTKSIKIQSILIKSTSLSSDYHLKYQYLKLTFKVKIAIYIIDSLTV